MSRNPSGSAGGREFWKVFTVADLDNLNGCPAYFRSILRMKPTELKVEFLRNDFMTLDKSEHSLLHITIGQPVSVGQGNSRKRWLGCNMDMSWVGGNFDESNGHQPMERAGTARITLVDYTTAHLTATAAYAFPAQKDGTVLDWINIFRGRTPITRSRFLTVDPTGDLMQEGFQFALGGFGEGAQGCRDYSTQCFVRLYALGHVRWEGQPVPVPNDPDGITIQGGNGATSVGFNHMIGHTHRIIYQEIQTGSSDTVRRPICLDSESSPMRRAEFAGDTQRVEVVLSQSGDIIRLPYANTPLEMAYGTLATLPPSGGYGDDQNWQDPSFGGDGGSRSGYDPQGQWEQQVHGGPSSWSYDYSGGEGYSTWNTDGQYQYSG